MCDAEKENVKKRQSKKYFKNSWFSLDNLWVADISSYLYAACVSALLTETFLCVHGGRTKCKIEHETAWMFSNDAAVSVSVDWWAVRKQNFSLLMCMNRVSLLSEQLLCWVLSILVHVSSLTPEFDRSLRLTTGIAPPPPKKIPWLPSPP